MKSWTEKLQAKKQPIKKHIDKAFAGMPAGCLMYISTPQEIDAYVRGIKQGELITPTQMRADLASRNGADHTCPVTTGIFLRIVAEAAFEELNNNQRTSEITPFWRVVEPGSPLSKKLTCGSQFIEDLRSTEQ
ncbi:MAG: hypothetical protein ACSHWU_08185 [Marinicella sp.]